VVSVKGKKERRHFKIKKIENKCFIMSQNKTNYNFTNQRTVKKAMHFKGENNEHTYVSSQGSVVEPESQGPRHFGGAVAMTRCGSGSGSRLWAQTL
jgi:hypothetical protein